MTTTRFSGYRFGVWRLASYLALWGAVTLMVFCGMAQGERESEELNLYKSEARSAYLRWLWTAEGELERDEGGPWKEGEALSPEIVERLLSVAGSQMQAGQMVRRVVGLLALDDAEAAMRVAASVDHNGRRRQALEAALWVWASRSPREALDWGRENLEWDLDSAQQRVLILGVARTEPLWAIEYANEAPDASVGTLARVEAVGVWGASEPMAALEWALTGLKPGEIYGLIYLDGVTNSRLGRVAQGREPIPDTREWGGHSHFGIYIERELRPLPAGLASGDARSPLARVRFGEGMEWARRLTHPLVRQHAMMIVGRLGVHENVGAPALNPDRYDWASSADRMAYLEGVLDQWIRENREDSAAFFDGLTEAADRERAFATFIPHWGKTSPDVALARLDRAPDPSARREAIVNLAGMWATQAPGDAFRYSIELTHGPTRQRALETVIRAWAREDAEAAIEAMGSVDGAEKNETWYRALLTSWSEVNPEAAAHWLEVSGLSRERYLDIPIRAWANQDATAAFEWMEAHVELRPMASWMPVIAELGQVDPGRAIRAAEALGPEAFGFGNGAPGGGRMRFGPGFASGFGGGSPGFTSGFGGGSPSLGTIFGRWMQLAPEEALEWAEQRPPSRLLVVGLPSILESLSRTDPDRALRLLTELPNNASARQAIQGLGNRLGALEPKLAARIVDAFPEEEAFERSISFVASRLAQEDAEFALEWAEKLTDLPKRQQALSGIVQSLGSKDPERALSVVSELPLPLQAGVLRGLVASWSANDPKACMAFIASIESEMTRRELYPAAFGQWIGRFPGEAMDWLRALDDRELQAEIARAASRPLAAVDPQGLLEFALELPESDATRSMAVAAVEQWAQRDLELATGFVESYEGLKTDAEIVGALARRWAEVDPNRGIELIAGIRNPFERNQQFRRFRPTWDGVTLESLERLVEFTEPGHERRSILRVALAKLELSQIADVRRFIETLKVEDERNDARRALFERWIALDAGPAMTALLALEASGETKQIQQAVFRTWAQSDLDAFVAWLRGVDDRGLQATAFFSGAPSWAQFIPAEAARFGASLPESSERDLGLQVVIQSWVRLNATQASAFVQSLPKGSTRDRVQVALIQALHSEDPDAAFRSIRALRQDEDFGAIAQLLNTGFLSEIDVGFAIALANDLPESRTHASAIRVFADRLSRVDLDRAKSWFQSVEGWRRDAILDGIERQWKRVDPEGFAKATRPATSKPSTEGSVANAQENEAAPPRSRDLRSPEYAKRLETALKGEGGSRDLGALFENWFREDARAAIDWLLQLEDTTARRQLSALAAPKIATRDPKSLFAFLEKLPNELERSLAIADVRTSLREDDNGALTPESKIWVDWLLASPEGPLREAIFNRIKWTWGRIDPDGMRAFVESMPSSPTRIYRAESFASIWAQTEPELAANWALSREEPRELERALGWACVYWGQQDREAALAFVKTIEDPEMRKHACDMTFNSINGGETSKALDIAMRLEDPVLRSTAARRVLDRMANADPERVWEIALSLPHPKEREHAAFIVCREWATFDPKACAEAIDQLPPGPTKDDALVGLGVQLNLYRPWEAADYANQIEDAVSRSELVEEIIFHWSRFDRPAATEFAENEARFPEEIRQEVLKRLRDWELPE